VTALSSLRRARLFHPHPTLSLATATGPASGRGAPSRASYVINRPLSELDPTGFPPSEPGPNNGEIMTKPFALGLLFLFAGCSPGLRDGTHAIWGSRGYAIADMGSLRTIEYVGDNGPRGAVISFDVREVELKADYLYVARKPRKIIVQDGLALDAPDGNAECEYWRINVKSHQVEMISKGDLKVVVDCDVK